MEEYTAKVVLFQSDLKGTNLYITNEELVREWHQGLGSELALANTAIDDLQVQLPQWSSVFPIYQLMEEANTHISKSSLDSANTYIGKVSHNSKSTGKTLDNFSSKSSKEKEKDKTTDKHNITKDYFSPKENLKPQTFFQIFKVWISGYDMSEKWWVPTRLF